MRWQNRQEGPNCGEFGPDDEVGRLTCRAGYRHFLVRGEWSLMVLATTSPVRSASSAWMASSPQDETRFLPSLAAQTRLPASTEKTRPDSRPLWGPFGYIDRLRIITSAPAKSCVGSLQTWTVQKAPSPGGWER